MIVIMKKLPTLPPLFVSCTRSVYYLLCLCSNKGASIHDGSFISYYNISQCLFLIPTIKSNPLIPSREVPLSINSTLDLLFLLRGNLTYPYPSIVWLPFWTFPWFTSFWTRNNFSCPFPVTPCSTKISHLPRFLYIADSPEFFKRKNYITFRSLHSSPDSSHSTSHYIYIYKEIYEH